MLCPYRIPSVLQNLSLVSHVARRGTALSVAGSWMPPHRRRPFRCLNGLCTDAKRRGMAETGETLVLDFVHPNVP